MTAPSPRIVTRAVSPPDQARLLASGLHPVLARVYAGRGIASPTDLGGTLGELLPPDGMLGIDAAAVRLADAIARREPMLIVADYDCDGATACAIGVRGLRAMGAEVDFLVPNRLEHGYGLTPPIVDLALAPERRPRPALIITVDNGIASLEGVARAGECGVDVIVTDHHLPGPALPQARAIVNPNQPGCGFASRHLAGVGVMFYVLLALRAELRRRGAFTHGREPALQTLLDLVALGTIADLVRLDRNNRLLVSAGLRRMRAGQAHAGVRALFAASGREWRTAGCEDIGFGLAPRINAAGRLADISVGIACLITDDEDHATELAGRLDAINRERRALEERMREQAVDETVAATGTFSRVLSRDDWHPGVVGLVASRIKDREHRPTIAFAPAGAPGQLQGSGRSIPGVHLRDAIDLAAKRAPGAVLRFGGHAMAAGLTIEAARLAEFRTRFDEAVATLADPGAFSPQLETDGSLAGERIDLDLIAQIDAGVWGQGFPAPLFVDEAQVTGQRLLKERHLRLDLRIGGQAFEAIAFGRNRTLGRSALLAYRLARNDWNGRSSVQLIVEHVLED